MAEAALRTIVEDGVHGFTTKAIAARVGITDGTLFRHFDSKAEIVLEAMGVLGEGIDAGLSQGAEPMADLEAFFRHRAAFVGSQGSVGRLIFSEGLMHLAGEEGQQVIRGWRRRTMAFLTTRLQALDDHGRLALTVDESTLLLQGTLLTFAVSAALGEAPGGVALQDRIGAAWGTMASTLFSP